MKILMNNQTHSKHASQHSSRRGFTLVELLVVVSIMLILAGITLTTINVTMDEERIGTGARQVQAFLEGARDRAIYAREPRGVRFIIDQNLSDLGSASPYVAPKYYCKSMVYIGPPSKFSEGFVSVYNNLSNSSDPNNLLLISLPTNRWHKLYRRGLLVDGARIRIFNTAETSWYTLRIIDDESNNFSTTGVKGDIDITKLKLTRAFLGSSLKNQRYELELEPTVLPDQEPRPFASGVVLDMSNSQVPTSWRTPQTNFRDVKLDILFATNGTVIGSAASVGSIHLLLADIVDTTQARGIGDPTKEGNEQIISVHTKTGNTQTNAVARRSPADPFYYAETGK